MVSKIRILSPELSNKIAAGEVVQRPASVVKELVENSIDSKATRINIFVKDAGKALVQVVDNGEGMAEIDASMAFRRHATSKIHSAADLEEIRTLGFRGEALASIAAIAQVELKTRSESDELATVIRIEGDEVKEKTKSAMDRGTSIIVRNLFYNTPARRNFLKTRQTELKNVTDVVIRMALAFPEIEWSYQSDDEVILDLKPKPFGERVEDIFGRSQYETMIGLDEPGELMRITGFLEKPNFARKRRMEQFVYINRRFIFSRMINHAVFHAYENILEKGSYPFFILNLELDPRKVDVNVHPSKMEVKFENESNVYRVVLSAVRKVFMANDLIPAITLKEGNGMQPADAKLQFDSRVWKQDPLSHLGTPVFPIRTAARTEEPQQPTVPNIIGLEEIRNTDRQADGSALPFEDAPTANALNRGFAQNTEADQSASGNRAIWQAHNKYIISQIRNGLMIVDQHVAHERIIYERVMANFENSLPSSQQLLFPEALELGAGDYSLVKDLLPNLESLGFGLRLFGKNTVVIDGIPADVRIGNERKILQEVLDEFKSNENAGVKDVRENLAKSFACKAAIKAGEKLNVPEMLALIEHLFLTKMPYVCPHGRPVIVRIPLEELDKRFGRT